MFLLKYYLKSKYIFSVFKKILQGNFSRTCPCCNYTGKFGAVGHPPRYDAICPSCGSFERHRLLALANDIHSLFKGKRVLHFAPEPIIKNIVINEASSYVTANIVVGSADVMIDIEHIDSPGDAWDVVICSHVLEHVDDKSALHELHRVLSSGGMLILMVPVVEGWDSTYENPKVTSSKEREVHFGQNDHVRYYGKDIRSRIEGAGFNIKEYTAFGEDVVEYGLIRGEKVFLCEKIA